MRDEMPQAEFIRWQVYDGRQRQRQELAAAEAKGGR